MIKNFLKGIEPYLLIIKIGAIVVFIVAVYGFGYTNARNKYAVKELKKENKEVKAVLKDTNKDINQNNEDLLKQIEDIQREKEEQQRLYNAQRDQIDFLSDKLKEKRFDACKLDQETVNALNKNIRGKL